MKPLILSLCDFSGIWSQPYADAGYDVRRIPGLDIRHRVDLAGRGWGILWKRLRFLKSVLDEVRKWRAS